MLLYWLWYAQLKTLSCAQKQKLLQYFRDPEEIYHAVDRGLLDTEDVTEALLEALEDRSLTEAEKILAECAEKGIGIVTLKDKAYPAKLRNTYDAPLVLYFKGRLPDWEKAPVIGIVGTRKATTYGMRAAYRFGGQITACGGLVVTGGAAGVDTMAVESALAAGGAPVCVFGCGVDVTYPAKNKKLFEEVAARGCILSEYPPRTDAAGWHFPQRNRIISGVSNGVLVVEAPAKSGALITARYAAEQGREVFAVPGNVDEPACAGSNGLLQEQAIAALSGWDVVKEYQPFYPGQVVFREGPLLAEKSTEKVAQKPILPSPMAKKSETPDKKSIDKEEKSTYSVVNNPPAQLNEQEQAVFEKIGALPIPVDMVIDAVDLPAGTVKSVLTRLTIKGLIETRPGGNIKRK